MRQRASPPLLLSHINIVAHSTELQFNVRQWHGARQLMGRKPAKRHFSPIFSCRRRKTTSLGGFERTSDGAEGDEKYILRLDIAPFV